eukprot:CAMPEP_0202696386 /NCGR_PEP_ID=MMETSP1385-20130828/9675_1 /ASSEMBLY_ACC=CAM_ASM_000861 /TAXON_ID=933848 /ORGANISM="Elphidium margaritaceum" /LENGTH=330 /DNA_ID=CAMNT_0049352543 /DNA_START=253 /DNA_END=1245 /DNA_ORIENTATION=-
MDFQTFVDTDAYNKLLHDLLAAQYDASSATELTVRVALNPFKGKLKETDQLKEPLFEKNGKLKENGKPKKKSTQTLNAKTKPSGKPSGKPRKPAYSDKSLDKSLDDKDKLDPKNSINPWQQYKQYMKGPGYLVKMNDEVFWAFFRLVQAIYVVDEKTGRQRRGYEEAEWLRSVLKTEAVQLVGRERSNFPQKVFKVTDKYKWELARGAVGNVPVVGTALRVSVMVIENFPRIVNWGELLLRHHLPMWMGVHGPQGKDGGGKYKAHKEVDDDQPFEPYNLYMMQEVLDVVEKKKNYDMISFRTDGKSTNPSGMFNCKFKKYDIWANQFVDE